MRRYLTGLFVAAGLGMLASVGAWAQGPHTDVPRDHWAYDAVNSLARQGTITGFPDGTFGGKRALTRYEFAVVTARLLPAAVLEPSGEGYLKAPRLLLRGEYRSLLRLAREFGPELKELLGDGTGLLRPFSRRGVPMPLRADVETAVKAGDLQEALRLVAERPAGVAGEPAPDSFWKDVPRGHWAYEYATSLARTGLAVGYPDGSFGGKRLMTRYEFAVVTARAVPHIEAWLKRPAAKGFSIPEPPSPDSIDFACLRRMVREIRPELEWLKVDTAQLVRDIDRLEREAASWRTAPRGAAGAMRFADVPRDHWAYDAVRELAARGLMIGYPEAAAEAQPQRPSR